MHDQLGASLTQISLLSQQAADPQRLEQLNRSARSAAEALDQAIWAVNPAKDTLSSLLHYLIRFADSFLGTAGIRCLIEVPTDVPEWPLPPEFRHHVFLIVKEALNNAVKYSGARTVTLAVTLSTDSLTVSVTDDGRGFDPTAVKSTTGGNGLRNLHERAAALGGECRIESRNGEGVRITLIAPWPNPDLVPPSIHP
jgi:signal transduction histidine kinase